MCVCVYIYIYIYANVFYFSYQLTSVGAKFMYCSGVLVSGCCGILFGLEPLIYYSEINVFIFSFNYLVLYTSTCIKYSYARGHTIIKRLFIMF